MIAEFEGVKYNDDRLFVLYVAPCRVIDEVDGSRTTTVYHDVAPTDHAWCVVTYRNTERYPAVRVDHFESREAAESYRLAVEPSVPRASLGGTSPEPPLTRHEFDDWKARHGVVEYDFRRMFSGTGMNPREIIVTPVSNR